VRVYADTSWWLAYKCRRDSHHPKAVRVFDQLEEPEIVWTPWHRVEVFNAFRQAERAGIVEVGDAGRMIRLLEQEVRLRYWHHFEFDWRNAVRTACEVSAEYSLAMAVRGMDLFHVSLALETDADAFLSFDREQRLLAEAAGLALC
jgi:predicted nucleic acid-binding protein